MFRHAFARHNPAAICFPCFDIPGDGGGGGGTGTGGDGGGGTGDPGPGGGTPGGGGTPASHYKLTDDSLVDLGDGKPVKWGEARTSRFMDRGQYDRGVEFLTSMARQLDAQHRQRQAPSQQQQQQQRPQAPQGPRPDPYADLEQMPVVDGRTLAKMAREMREQGLGPIASMMGQFATRMQQLEGQFQQSSRITGSLAEQHQATEFEGIIDKTLQGLAEIKGLQGKIPHDDKDLRELVKDVYLSHNQNDPNLMRELPGLVKNRLETAVRVIRAMDKQAHTDAEGRRKSFFDPKRGSGAPTGQGKYQFETPAQLADQFFGSQQQST